MTMPVGRGVTSLGGPGLRAFARIVYAWGLEDDEQLAILGRPLSAAFAPLEDETLDDLARDARENQLRARYLSRTAHPVTQPAAGKQLGTPSRHWRSFQGRHSDEAHVLGPAR